MMQAPSTAVGLAEECALPLPLAEYISTLADEAVNNCAGNWKLTDSEREMVKVVFIEGFCVGRRTLSYSGN